MLAVVNERVREWRLGEQILVTLPDGQVVRCRVVNVLDDGAVQVVPEHEVVIGQPHMERHGELGMGAAQRALPRSKPHVGMVEELER